MFSDSNALISDNVSSDLNFDVVAANVDNTINKKYPQLSKLIKYPNRAKQIKLYQNVHEKLLKRAQKKNEEPLYSGEREGEKRFEEESIKLGKENMKTFLLLNQQKTHGIPEDIRKSLIALKMYYDIPIINSVLMAPFNDNSNWKKGSLLALTPKKLRDYLKLRFIGGSEPNQLTKFPEYRLILNYIKGNGKYQKIKKILKKNENAYANPKKMATRIVNSITRDNSYNPTSKADPAKFMAAKDLRNLDYLKKTMNANRLNGYPDRSENIRPFVDKYINKGYIKTDGLDDYYKKFAPPYAKLLNKNLN